MFYNITVSGNVVIGYIYSVYLNIIIFITDIRANNTSYSYNIIIITPGCVGTNPNLKSLFRQKRGSFRVNDFALFCFVFF